MKTNIKSFREKQRLLNDAIVEQLRNELRPLIKEAVAELQHHMPLTSTDTSDRYISRRHAARSLGVSVQTIAKMLKGGLLAFSRIGRRVLIRESDVVALIRYRQSPNTEAL